MSSSRRVSSVMEELARRLVVEPAMMKLWDYRQSSGQSVLNPSHTFREAAIADGQLVLVEVALRDGTWPRSRLEEEEARGAREEREALSATLSALEGGELPAAQRGDGLVGLSNLGNTCFMNSALQCLAHTDVLLEYFTSKRYLFDVNTRNPLGYQGRLAHTFALLVQDLWQANRRRPVVPRQLKAAIAGVNEGQFAGNEQHDAQELLSFLLSGLSEDLNRIHEKPYIENPDSDGRPDTELAQIWWQNHLRRELSIIVALFTGQFRQVMTCGACGYASARFDVFTTLSLPLPQDPERSVLLRFTPAGGRRPLLCAVRVRRAGTLGDVVGALVALLRREEGFAGLLRKRVFLVDVNESVIVGFVPNKRPLREVKENTVLHAIEVACLPELQEEDEEEEEEAEEEEEEEEGGNGAADEASGSGEDGLGQRSARAAGSSGEDLPRESGESAPGRRTAAASENGAASAENGAAASENGAASAENGAAPAENGAASAENGAAPAENGAAPAENGAAPAENGDAFADAAEGGPAPAAGAEDGAEAAEPATIFPVVHRSANLMKHYFVQSLRVSLFGAPMLVRLTGAGVTCRALYDHVYAQVRRFYREGEAPMERGAAGGVGESPGAAPEDPPGMVAPTVRHVSMGEEEMFAGAMPRCGFRLRIVHSNYISSPRDGWLEGHSGLQLPDAEVPLPALMTDEALAVDWHYEAFAELISHAEVRIVDTHASVEEAKAEENRPLTLQRAMDVFSEEETIPDGFCSKCRDFRSSTLKSQIWRLPPVLVLHLKRFQYTTYSRRKLNNTVDFPLEGLDLTQYLAGRDAAAARSAPEGAGGNPEGDPPAAGEGVTDGILGAEDGGDAQLYDLYGVLHHVGVLGAGHYVATIRGGDGKWYCFNDGQVHEVKSDDVVSASAYVLFYRRRDLAEVKLDDMFPQVDGAKPISDKELSSLVQGRDLQQRCKVM